MSLCWSVEYRAKIRFFCVFVGVNVRFLCFRTLQSSAPWALRRVENRIIKLVLVRKVENKYFCVVKLTDIQ